MGAWGELRPDGLAAQVLVKLGADLDRVGRTQPTALAAPQRAKIA